uniref:Variant surface glycoprotein 467 n=1 Tax=Trypanosoma brucei TaxID=5691 RepID=M4SX43_9TRYP|nr:variant surface glycoprotein 467 [Trypanosoma brucei]
MQLRSGTTPRYKQALKAFFLLEMAFRTAEQATVTSAVNSFCTETWYIDKLKETLQTRAQQAARAAAEATKEARLFSLASTRYAFTPQGPGYNALSMLATSRAAALTTELPEYVNLVNTALVLLAQRQGNLNYMEALHNENVPKGAKGTASSTAGPSLLTGEQTKTCTVEQTVTVKTIKDCATEQTKRTQAEEQAKNLDGWTHILVRGTAQITKVAITTVGGTKGTPNLGGSITSVTDEPGCGDAGSDQGISGHTNALAVSAKAISLKYAGASIKVEPPTVGAGAVSQEPGQDQPHKIQLIATDENLRRALVAALNAPVPSAKKVPTETLATVLADPAITKLLETMATPQGKKSEKQLTADDKATLLFGTSKADIQTLYIKHLENDEITISSEPEIKGTTKKLSENNFAAAMGYFARENQKKLAASALATTPGGDGKTDTADKTGEKKDGDNKTTAADCTGAEEGKCDKNKCTWDKNKNECKIKEGTFFISAVMKAPLLLSVLLL